MCRRELAETLHGPSAVVTAQVAHAVPFEFLDESTQAQSIPYIKLDMHCLWIQLSLASRFNSQWIAIPNRLFRLNLLFLIDQPSSTVQKNIEASRVIPLRDLDVGKHWRA